VKFSNNPNKTYNGTPEDQNHPGFPDSTQEVPTGETPESITKTYTTGIKIQKVDENGEPIVSDVEFELSGQSVKKVVTKTETFTEDSNGTYYKLKNGTYTTIAPTSENTMIEAEAGATKGYVEDNEATGDDAVTADGKTYRPYAPATDAGKKIYVLKEGSADAYVSTTVKYKKTVTKKTEDSDATDHKMSEAVDSNGIVRFDGLGEGDYTISETRWPNGYNQVADVTLHITYNDGTPRFSAENATYEDGVLKIRVINKKGVALPSTGGIGTTIFYIVGGVMVAGAVVFLLTKRRVAGNE
jgi:LPXTG-motif cell wall-anchored protein